MVKTINLKSPECTKLLKNHTRALVHLRQQKEKKQFGLVFGAGIGTDLGFPSWNDLLLRIAKHRNVKGKAITKKWSHSTALAQQLFQHYKSQITEKADPTITGNMLEMTIRAGWRLIVHECLYQGIPPTISQLLKKDRYLEALVPLIKESPLTVTYNFDDTLQRLLAKHSSQDEKGSATYWSGNVQLNAKRGSVIYHPNGFLPYKLAERPSDHLVFLEDSFVDQLIDSMSGQYASLATHISKTTCLFVGLSLADPGLKHLLRQSAKAFPGHYHYYISFVADEKTADPKLQKIEADVNFDVYNLITLHLTASQIKALAVLLAVSDSEFEIRAEEVSTCQAFRYYIVGSVSAGKSTTVSCFRSVVTQDEWVAERAKGMEKAPHLLSSSEKKRIDSWVAEQVSLKNTRLKTTSKTGIHVIDRAPLDAFAFTPDGEWKAKAKLLKNAIGGGGAHRTIVEGHVIFLHGTPEIMAERAISLHKNVTASSLKLQQEKLLKIYGGLPPNGFSKIDTQGRASYDVIKQVAKVIFQKPYVAANLQERLAEFEKTGEPK
jgi:hypothetical protein